jgi:hypothetical protein
MLRCWIRSIVVLTVLCILPVLIIRAQPYDDHELRAFLLPPEDCRAPCFMGIRPGVTTAREALDMLNNHAWVETVWIENNPLTEGAFNYHPDQPAELSWSWERTAPRWININTRGWLSFRRGYVNTMVVDTHLRFGETLLILGKPDNFAVRVFGNRSERTFRLSAWYLDSGTVITAGGLCPMRKFELRVPLVFISGFQPVEPFDTRQRDC